MIIVVIVSLWLGVIALVVGLDVGISYLADKQIEKHRNEGTSLIVGTKPSWTDDRPMTLHNYQRIELGIIRVEKRIPHTHGMHRRTRAS